MDFRVSSDNNADMFFVDGGDDKVGIGMSNPVAQFAVGGAGRRIEISGGDGVIRGYDRTSSWAAIDFEAASYTFDCGGTLALTIDSSRNATFAGSVTTGGNLHIAPGSNTPYITGGAVSTVFRNNANNASLITILNNGNTTFAGLVSIASTTGIAINSGADVDHDIINLEGITGGGKLIWDHSATSLDWNKNLSITGNVLVGTTSTVTNEKLRVNGAQVVGSGAAGLYTTTINQSFAASASKYLRIQLNNNLFGALTITATGNYSSVNAIGVYQKVYSVGINSSNTSIYSAGNTTTLDMGGTSGQFSMGTPSKPNATTYYVPLANLNASYAIEMSIVVEMRGYILGIASVDIIAA
jgi:hypothetical protein